MRDFLNPSSQNGKVFYSITGIAVVGVVFSLTPFGKKWIHHQRAGIQKSGDSMDAIDAEKATDDVVAENTLSADEMQAMSGYSSAEGGNPGNTPAGAAFSGLGGAGSGITSAALLSYGKDSAGRCVAVEIPGHGIASEGWTEAEWIKTQGFFAEGQKKIVDWVKGQVSSKGLEQRIADVFISQVHSLKIERPSKDEPDLGWRGIVTFSFDSSANPIIRVGGGFSDLAKKNPSRAQFEMVRAMAQSWSPCELQKMKVSQPWNNFLGCMKIQAKESCEIGQYSEAGWAVSTWVAQNVSSPGCTIRALNTAVAKSCVAKMKWTADVEIAGGIRGEAYSQVEVGQ